jgi:ParB family chromosome partitioning protein
MAAKRKSDKGEGAPATKRAARPKNAALGRKTPRKQKAASTGLDATACVGADVTAQTAAMSDLIVAAGGAVIGSYRDPLGGTPLVMAMLPIDRIAPTPFQRDLSDTHHKRLAEVIQKTARFLDPLIAVTASADARIQMDTAAKGDGPVFWTPNGMHRLEAMRRLGAKAVTALVVADREVAWQILALNTEKAHNLKERALEVIRIYRGLVEEDGSRPEVQFSFYLEDPALITIGVAYEANPRFAAGAYHPVLRRVERFSEGALEDSLGEHEARAAKLAEVETEVVRVVTQLRERGLTSPYLRSFVVARINPLRWVKPDAELPTADAVLETMRQRAARFDAS